MMIHAFERAGLGTAPYQFLGVEKISFQAAPDAPSQPGGSCDFCGTGIHFHYRLRSADGRTFKVGSDCILKSGDAGLRRVVADQERHARQDKARVKTAAQIVYISAAVVRFHEHLDIFQSLPHPRAFKDFATGAPLTLADYVRWMIANAGHAGRYATAKMIDQTLETR